MRSAISASPGCAVATRSQGGRSAAIKPSAYRLLPDRAPPSTSVSLGIVDSVTSEILRGAVRRNLFRLPDPSAQYAALLPPYDPLPQRSSKLRRRLLTNDTLRPLSSGDRRSLNRGITGNTVRKTGLNPVFNAAAAPATVSGESTPQSHWGKSREGGAGR